MSAITKLWEPLVPKHGRLMILTGYIDESYDGKDHPDDFTLSCIMTTADDWKQISGDWRHLFEEINKQLITAGRKPITRYKAAECNGSSGEFEGWTPEEKRSLNDAIFAIFERTEVRLTTMAYSVRLSRIHAKIPSVKDPKSFAYAMLFVLIIKGVIEMMKTLDEPSTISFIYDHCDYDLVYLCVFDNILAHMKNDPDTKMLTTVDPMNNVNCPALEVADLMAYENYKRHLNENQGLKKKRTLDYMLEREIIGGRSSIVLDEQFEIEDFQLRFLKWCSSYGGKKLRYPEIDALSN